MSHITPQCTPVYPGEVLVPCTPGFSCSEASSDPDVRAVLVLITCTLELNRFVPRTPQNHPTNPKLSCFCPTHPTESPYRCSTALIAVYHAEQVQCALVSCTPELSCLGRVHPRNGFCFRFFSSCPFLIQVLTEALPHPG